MVWVRKWIDGSDQVSESLLTTRDGAISRLGITWCVASGVNSWPQRRLEHHCTEPPSSRNPLTSSIKDHGKSYNLFYCNPTQFTPMSEPVLWCNVQSAVLPGICGLGWLLGRDHSLPQSSKELVAVNKAVMGYMYNSVEVDNITNVSLPVKLYFNCALTLNAREKHISVLVKYSCDLLLKQGLPCSGADTRPGLIITVKCEPSDNNLPWRMLRWTLLRFFNYLLSYWKIKCNALMGPWRGP